MKLLDLQYKISEFLGSNTIISKKWEYYADLQILSPNGVILVVLCLNKNSLNSWEVRGFSDVLPDTMEEFNKGAESVRN